jgi:Tol biopolymer transport system component
MLVDYSIASHYHWRDPENLVMVVKRPGEEINLREFRDRSQESRQFVHEFFKDDGHCSYSPDRQWLLYDSYPQEGYRYLYVYHLASGQGWCLGGVKTLPRKEGVEMEIRCDLHPRWNRAGDAISFDSIHEGFRGVYSMKIGPLLRQWAATTTQGASVKK